MRAYDLTPLMRSTIGFDRFDRLFDAAARAPQDNGYPPYNIEKSGDDDYRITMAVAGFTGEDLDITVENGTLTVTGRQAPEAEDSQVKVLHRGIARRAFERRFELAENIRVAGADLRDGLLHIDLVREVPEHMKPRRIEIENGRQAA
jgi:molecular chaperone IbpA